MKDEKIQYLVRTLSRTKRKDFENYVINAIWNRIDNNNIKPVTQQFVINSLTNERYFIDLYFPQLLIGIEIDERHHAFQKEEDYKRSNAIWYEINKISSDRYHELRIDVADKSFVEIETQINEVVNIINKRINKASLKAPVYSVEEFITENDKLTIYDDVVFNTINQTCNLLFKTNFSDSGGPKNCFFLPKKLKDNSLFKNTRLWFPKLAVEEDGVLKAVSAEWNNRLNSDGTILEFNEKTADEVSEGYEELITENNFERYVFARFTDPLGRNGYKFIGRFHHSKRVAIMHNGKFRKCEYYELISTEIPVL